MARIELKEATIRQLEYVPTEKLRPGVYDFPDFLVIGPQRTGTTWLHRNLNFHPDILLSPRKELHYFNGLGQSPDKVNSNIESQRLEQYCENFSGSWRNFLKKNFWNLAYFRNIRAIELRKSAFSASQVKGELTASYAAMDISRIREICRLNPGIRAVVMLRNPVDRAWSHAKLQARSAGRSIDDFSDQELHDFLTSDYQLRCGSYGKIIENWQKCLATPDHLFVGLYDRIKSEPVELLSQLLRFIGVSASTEFINQEAVGTIVNPTFKSAVPETYRGLLRGIFQAEIEMAVERFGADWAAVMLS